MAARETRRVDAAIFAVSTNGGRGGGDDRRRPFPIGGRGGGRGSAPHDSSLVASIRPRPLAGGCRILPTRGNPFFFLDRSTTNDESITNDTQEKTKHDRDISLARARVNAAFRHELFFVSLPFARLQRLLFTEFCPTEFPSGRVKAWNAITGRHGNSGK